MWRWAVLVPALAISALLIRPERVAPGVWAARASSESTLSVMTFNILKGGRPASDALDAIAAARPDIVCLQEMTAELAAEFETRLGARYPYRLFRPNPNAQGIGIASRYPLAGGKTDMLGLRFLPSLAVTVRAPSMAVRAVCVHLIPPQAGFRNSDDLWATYQRNKALRLRQVANLLKLFDGPDRPAVIIGDLNEWPGQAAVAELVEAGFEDSCDAAGSRCGATWPGRLLPLPATFRIDYILGRGVTFTDAATLDAGGSDHYPVAAHFAIRPVETAQVKAH